MRDTITNKPTWPNKMLTHNTKLNNKWPTMLDMSNINTHNNNNTCTHKPKGMDITIQLLNNMTTGIKPQSRKLNQRAHKLTNPPI